MVRKKKVSKIFVQGCQCGVNHNAPTGSGEVSGFGLSFQNGAHTLYWDGSRYRTTLTCKEER